MSVEVVNYIQTWGIVLLLVALLMHLKAGH